MSVSLFLEEHLEIKMPVHLVNVGDEARKHQQRSGKETREATNQGGVTKQVTTVGSWDQILLGTLEASVEHGPHNIVLSQSKGC